MKENRKIENCISTELSNLVIEFNNETLTVEDLYCYISTILLDSGLDSRIIVNILERDEFGELGKNEALRIKVTEGW